MESIARGHGDDAHDAPGSALPSPRIMAETRRALVLLADDDPGSLKLLSEALAGEPLTLAVAIDGETALRQVKRHLPDLVLLDAMMPDLDGFQVCGRLRADPATRDVPIIFMTALSDTASRVRGLELGAVDYVTKPFVREELLARTRTQLAIRAAAKALSEKNEELSRARDSLEMEVRRRTQELRVANERLALELESSRVAEIQIRKAQDELAHMNRVAALSELAGSIAHELNQPLAAILSNAQAAQRLLAQTPPDIGEARAALDDIVADDRRAGRVIARMRAMLRKGELGAAAALDAGELVGEVIRLVASAALLAGATLRSEVAPGLPPARGDGVQIQQVLLNLIVNALDAVARRPADARSVIVRAAAAGSEIDLSVSDSGEGIRPEDLERIFEPFVTTKSHGLGLGLAISRSIVEAHGGRLWAESRPGGGATLRCVLPAWEEVPGPQ